MLLLILLMLLMLLLEVNRRHERGGGHRNKRPRRAGTISPDSHSRKRERTRGRRPCDSLGVVATEIPVKVAQEPEAEEPAYNPCKSDGQVLGNGRLNPDAVDEGEDSENDEDEDHRQGQGCGGAVEDDPVSRRTGHFREDDLSPSSRWNYAIQGVQ